MTVAMPRLTLSTRGTVNVVMFVGLHVISLSTRRMRIFHILVKHQVGITSLPLSTTVVTLTPILATDLHRVKVLLVAHLMYVTLTSLTSNVATDLRHVTVLLVAQIMCVSLIILATRIIIITITKY